MAATLQAIGFGSQNLSPVLIEGLRQGRGLTEGMAGLVQTVELVTTAISAFLLASLASRMSPRRLALSGAVIAAIAHFASSLAEPLYLLLFLRVVAGVGAAMCVCAANVVLSAQREPDRIYAGSYAASALAGIVVLPFMVYIGALTDGWGVYAIDGAWVVVLLPLVALLPARLPDRTATEDHEAIVRSRGVMLLPLAAIGLFSTFSVGLWAFSGVVAEAAHVTAEFFGMTLSVGTALCFGGAWLASTIGTRYGRLPPLLGGIVATLIASTIFFSATTPIVFGLSFVVAQTIYAFIMPFMFGFCSSLDRTGKLAIAASSAILISASVAPALIGWLIQAMGLAGLIAVMTIGYLLSALAFYASTRLIRDDAEPVSGHLESTDRSPA
nr:MFS transporter [Sphingobium boeckii]